MSSVPESDLAGLFGGRFRIGELLGAGGSAAVYRCVDFGQFDALGRPTVVALKVLHPAMSQDPALREAFLREAGRLAGVHHGNVAAVRASGVREIDATPLAWIALEVVEGPTLSEWVAEHGPLDLDQAVAVMDGLLSGLQAAHDADLVHRDIAPGNVILHDVDPDEVVPAAAVRLVDFGLADAAGSTVVGNDVLLATSESSGEAPAAITIVGSAEYLSPEQAAAGGVGPASDLYQAGAVLHFLLTGQPPFHRATVAQTVQARLTDPPPVPSALRPTARRLDRVVVKALAVNPRARFASAEEFRQELLAAVSTPVGSGPTRVMETGWAQSTTDDGSVPRQGNLTASLPPRGSQTDVGGGLTRVIPPVLLGALAVAVVVWIGVGMAGAGPLAVPLAAGTSAAPSASPTVTAQPSPDTPAPSPDQVRVPALFGDLAAARAALAGAGLDLGRVRSRDSAEPAGQVLAQSPKSGTLRAVGDTVEVTVASGYNRVPVVTGMTVIAAQAVLESAGFVVATNGEDPASLVGGSQPAAGARLLRGVTVAVVVGSDTPAPQTPAPLPSATP
ncbi:MAG: PASTA domain-containing protein [Propionicimonas sp.]